MAEDPRDPPSTIAAVVEGSSSALTATGSRKYVAFESGPVRPLAMSADNQRLFAVNTPDNTLEVFKVAADGTLSKQYSVPVGMEPVSVAARNSKEVWVVDHLSDSVSVVDVSSNPPRVVRTLLVGDEPRDIVFAGTDNSRAFITTAHRGQHRSDPSISGVPGAGDPQLSTAGVGRADVWVFDPESLGNTLGGTPQKIITLYTDTPRALAVSNDKQTVYAAGHKTGNRTAMVPNDVICVGFGSTPCTVSGTTYPAGLPGPGVNHAGATAPHTSNIVRFNAGTGKWDDQLGRDWSAGVKFALPDKDVFAINVSSLSESTNWSGVGTVLFNMAVNPVSGKIYVSNTEANNFDRFEGDGAHSSGESLRGEIAKTRITVIDGSTVTPRHLNKHINYATAPASVPTSIRDASLSTPTEMVVTGDGTKLYVAAFGSSKVGVFATSALESNSFNPVTDSANYITVTGGGPGGLVLDEERGRLYVLTRFDNSISVVNTSTQAEAQHIGMFNPEPATVKDGRRFLYDAVVSSANGESSCASCHIFGDNDDLGWNLGDPGGNVNTTPVNVRLAIGASGFTPAVNGSGTTSDMHPMKGPMTTQTLRGMQNSGHMHWRGDRVVGFFAPNDTASLPPYDERKSFKNFIVAFEGLLGRASAFSTTDMDKFADFTFELVMPPNPVRNLDNSLTTDQALGRKYFMGCDGPDSQTTINPAPCSNGRPVGMGHNADGLPFVANVGHTCEGCHKLDPANGYFGTDGENSFETLPQTMKIPHLRNVYTKVGMFGLPAVPTIIAGNNGFLGDQIRGFGFLHDGSVDTVFRFFSANTFANANGGVTGFLSGSPGDVQRRNVEKFVQAFDTDLAPVVGQQITLNSTNSAAVTARIDLLKARAAANFSSQLFGTGIKECDLVATGIQGGLAKRWLYRAGTSNWEPDDGSANISDTTLRGYAATVGQEVTFLCTPPGSGTRIGLDRDADDRANRNETCPNLASCGGTTACGANLGNCDNNDGTGAGGCETTITTSLAHCGGCGLVCDLANAGESCASGVCTLGSCAGGWSDCDGLPGNGCEFNGATCPALNQVSAGDDHGCALLASNSTQACWGQNGSGQLGDGTSSTRAAATQTSLLSNAIQASAGTNFSCSLKNDNTVVCWGSDGDGQNGNGAGAGSITPVAVSSLTNVKQISTSGGADTGTHACAVLNDGTIKCWGKGSDGQLGNGSTASQPAPVAVTGISNAVAVSAGRNHSCAALRDGSVKCWGKNDQGQLGDGSTTNSTTAVVVLNIGDAARIEAGKDATCVVRTNGRLKCWGINYNGQLGDGSTTNRKIAVNVTGITNARFVSIGDDHTCSLLSDGTATCWGSNGSGQLGDNSTTQRTTPVTVSGLSGLIDIAAGDEFSCGMKSDRRVFCWGVNWGNQLGDGTTTNRSVPVSASGFPKLAPESDCIYGSYGGSTYWRCETSRTWSDARSKCQARTSTDLLTVADASESAYVNGFINDYYYVGYTDATTEGSWTWLAGGAGYPNWDTGNPNGGNPEDCGWLNNDAKMGDRACTDTLRYLCKSP